MSDECEACREHDELRRRPLVMTAEFRASVEAEHERSKRWWGVRNAVTLMKFPFRVPVSRQLSC